MCVTKSPFINSQLNILLLLQMHLLNMLNPLNHINIGQYLPPLSSDDPGKVRMRFVTGQPCLYMSWTNGEHKPTETQHPKVFNFLMLVLEFSQNEFGQYHSCWCPSRLNAWTAWSSTDTILTLRKGMFVSSLRMNFNKFSVEQRYLGPLLLTWINFNPSMDK